MRRRQVLSALGAGLIAGCSSQTTNESEEGGESTATPTQTSTPSPTRTSTETPSPTRTSAPTLEIGTFTPVLERINFQAGETIAENRTGGFGTNGYPVFGHEGIIPVQNGSAEYSYEIALRKDGREVDSYSSDQLSEIVTESETYTSNHWTTFGTGNWDLGTHTAELTVLNSTSGTTVTKTTEFQINRALSSEDVEILTINAPTRVQTGEQFTLSIEIRNLTNRDSSYNSPASYRYNGSQWQNIEDATYNLPANSTTIFRSYTTIDRPGNYAFRLDELGITYSVTVVG